MKKFAQVIFLPISMLVVSLICSFSVNAVSSSKTGKIPQLDASVTIDAWLESSPQDKEGEPRSRDFQVTGKYSSSKRGCEKPQWLKIEWSFETMNLSWYTETDAGLRGGEWTNTIDTTHVWYRGNVVEPTANLSIKMIATVSGLCSGVPFSVSTAVTGVPFLGT